MLMSLSRRRRTGGGFLLAAALAVLFALFTIAIALHWMGASARSAYMASEAQFEAEQSLHAQMAEKGAKLQQVDQPPAPTALEVGVKVDADSREQIAPPAYGKDIFGAAGQKAKGFAQNASYYDSAITKVFTDYPVAPWHSLFAFKPTSWRVDYATYLTRRYVSSYSADFPFAAYAPEGKITVKQAAAWSNPALTEAAADPTGALSGVPVSLAAKDDVTVSDAFPLGEVWSAQGQVKLPKGSGAVAWRLKPPVAIGVGQSYADRLVAQITDAMGQLSSAADAGDKTANVITGIDIGDFIDVLFGDVEKMQTLFSMRNALKFPLPILPGFASQPPHYQLIFHMPYAPDLSGGAKLDASMLPQLDKAKVDALIAAKEKLDNLKAQLQKAIDEFNANPIDLLKDKVDSLTTAVKDAQSVVDSLTAEINAQNQAATTALKALAEGSDQGALTRADEDASGLDDDGDTGYCYSQVFKALWGMMEGLIDAMKTGNGRSIMSKMVHEVRLIYFGRPSNVAVIDTDGGKLAMKATWVVPRGRTLKFAGDFSIQGDLWVQRGAVLNVIGNLTVAPPGVVSDTDPLKPSGRVVLEEGASIVVGGNFTCQGGPRFGSVLTCGPFQQVHPLTSAILANGSVTIPNGIYSSAVLDEMTASLAGSDMLKAPFTSLVPNAGKVAGPFHRRKPYIASYATIIGIVVPVPFIGILVFPEPTAQTNLHVPIFRMMSLAYAGMLNATFGENLFTHCDWWVFGDGVVPALPKVDPTALAGVVKAVANAFPTLATNIASWLGDLLTNVVTELVTTLVTKLSEEIISKLLEAVPYGSIVSGAVKAGMDKLTQAITDKIKEGIQKGIEAVSGVDITQANLVEGGVVEQLKQAVKGVLDSGALAALSHECAGVLVFGRNGVSVGTSGGAPIAAGMFVSDKDIVIGTDFVVGSLLSAHGSITAKNVLYYPYYTRASLPIPSDPAPGTGGWLQKAIDHPAYGGDMYGENETPGAVDIGLPVQHVTAGGWDK